MGILFNGEYASVCRTSPGMRVLPVTPEPTVRWDLLPLTSYMGQLSLLMRFFGCSCGAPAEEAASCLGSVYNPFHRSIKSLGITSTDSMMDGCTTQPFTNRLTEGEQVERAQRISQAPTHQRICIPQHQNHCPSRLFGS